jgi:hypothetical protein
MTNFKNMQGLFKFLKVGKNMNLTFMESFQWVGNGKENCMDYVVLVVTQHVIQEFHFISN